MSMFSVIKTIGRKSLATLKSQSELLPIVFLVGLLVSSAIAFANQNITDSFVQNDSSVTELLEVNLETNTPETTSQNETIPENITDIPLPENIINETNPIIEENVSVNVSSNETIPLPIENIINRTTENITDISLPETNITNETEEETEKISPIPPQEEIVLNIRIESPEKITRGEIVTIKSTVVNSGSTEAKSVILTWQLPKMFEIVSGSQEKNCGNLEPNGSCTSEISVLTSYSTELGKNDVKVVVSYE